MKRLLNWLDNLWHDAPVPQRSEIRYQIIQRDPFRLRLAEWCSSKDLTHSAATCINDNRFRMMLDVLENEHPANIVLDDKVSMESRAIWQARCEGYTMCLANIDAMTVHRAPREALEATFDPAERDTTETEQ